MLTSLGKWSRDAHYWTTARFSDSPRKVENPFATLSGKTPKPQFSEGSVRHRKSEGSAARIGDSFGHAA